jgi:predicted AlkP superfamily phosphohydrolase/phosphomutase
MSLRTPRITVLLALAILLFTESAHAYIGPGAGFALVSSFFILVSTFISAFVILLTWPLKWAIRSFRGRRALANSQCKRVVILGLDGQDPELTDRFIAEGLMPNFKKLAEQGTYQRLGTSLLAESPVAWSCFQTGCNPGRHKIFDFLVPNRKSYLPELSSAQVQVSDRVLSLGKYQFPLGKPTIDLGRKSQPFWKILGDHGVFSNILRVPITFPPEKFHGVMLSAMCVPDLKGSQGTFYFYTSNPDEKQKLTSGEQHPATYTNGVAEGTLVGPENPLLKSGDEMTIPFKVNVKDGECELVIDKMTYTLPRDDYTPWIRLNFKAGFGVKAQGLARFYLLDTEPHFRLYVTPIQIDPDKPALPISHPFTYAVYLAKTLGPFATLGVAEDTSGLNEGILSEDAFKKQAYIIHEEREKMFFDALKKTRHGLVTCVFDITDRIQHMFFRHLDEDHPANRGRDNETHRDAIKQLYIDMDDLLGRTMQEVGEDEVLMVMSDHGFKSFRRGVNLNTWLLKNGFMTLKENPTGNDMFADVDWSKTKAYAVGFGGMYLNIRGREAQGIVEPGEEVAQVKQAIIEGLKALYDDVEEARAVREVYDSATAYQGPYTAEAPDLIAGFKPGFRVSWESVTGGFTDDIIVDNDRPWSGDHNFNPPDVPGIFLSNRTFPADKPHITDIAPTVLELFGVKPPKYFDGESLLQQNKDSVQNKKQQKEVTVGEVAKH